jgi:double-stranded uracil-DNA glycosylase
VNPTRRQAASGDASAQCFAPVAADDARILILGSMPGQASLRATQYYAHQRNAFWPIMAALFDAGIERQYADRLALLQRQGIALWDVLASCERPGSLDADIEPDSIVVNDFAGFFDRHTRLQRIVFNGTTAEQCFRRHVDAATANRVPDRRRLPSTSPAHAGMRFADKLERWREALI